MSTLPQGVGFAPTVTVPKLVQLKGMAAEAHNLLSDVINGRGCEHTILCSNGIAEARELIGKIWTELQLTPIATKGKTT